MLSLEHTKEEDTWSAGEYVSPQKVWDAFKVPGTPPAPRGVFATQPNPRAANARWFRAIFALCAVLLVGGCFARVSGDTGRQVMQDAFQFVPFSADSGAVASQEFTLGGRTSNVEVEIETSLDNGWGFFDIALIDAEHGTAKEVGREISYYHGVEDGESWSEGNTRESVTIPEVPPGRYFLRIGAEGEAPYGYNVRVRRDVPDVIAFVIALVLLALPWAYAEFRSYSFEFDRWAESDHPMRSASSSSSSDDD
jgi:hypothetical protein